MNQIEIISGTESKRLGLVAGLWALVGFVLIIGRAVLGMSPVIHQTLSTSLSGFELAVYAAAMLLFGVGKGHFIFHRRFCPRYVARAVELCSAGSSGFQALFAPLYCLNLIGSDRAGLIRGYSLVTAIALMIVSTKLLPPPWRGMILTGVAVALTWAALEIAYQGFRVVMETARTDST